jgi:hypothetical protein
MRALVIENGVVVNTIIIDSLDHPPELFGNLISGEQGGSIGDLWDGSTLTTPIYNPPIAPTPTKEELLTQLNALSAQIQAL